MPCKNCNKTSAKQPDGWYLLKSDKITIITSSPIPLVQDTIKQEQLFNTWRALYKDKEPGCMAVKIVNGDVKLRRVL